MGPSVPPPTTPNVKQNQSSVEGPSAKDLTPESIGTPVSSKMVDDQGEAIDSSPATSTISAGSATPSLPRGRGRPRKLVTKPDFSDFPVDGSYEDQERWFKAKRTKIWRYNMLSSDQEAAYRAWENRRTSKHYHDNKTTGRPRTQRTTSTATSASADKDNLDGIELLDIVDTSRSTAQELSRQR